MQTNNQANAEEDIVDLRKALDDVEGDRELLLELASICREDMPGFIERLQRSLAVEDFKDIGVAAHQMKGLCSIFHSPAHRQQSELVEQLCATQNTAEIESAVERLCVVSRKVVDSLASL